MHFEQTKYSQLERLYTEQSKELQLCGAVLAHEQQESDLMKQELSELEGMKISIGQYE